MCGIVGFVGPYDQTTLQVMTEAMTHRGPDDVGYHHASLPSSEYCVGIGHRRLSIIDLNTGQQPIWNEDRTMAITFNGEIYNYRQVRAKLKAAGHRFSTETDTEVILHGYEEYGQAVVDYLEGMFAFGIWDDHRQSWYLARDRFGIKPLYYCRLTSGELAFASEIKPLLFLANGSKVNLEALYHYLLYGWISTEETIFQGIYQLRPAHWLEWIDGVTNVQRYWQLEPTEQKLSPEKWAEMLHAKLSEAVESHLIADVPVGITLSGGLDSSAVLAMMSRAMEPDRIQAFTIGYGRDDDETKFSRQAAAHVGVTAHEREISLAQVSKAFSKMLWHLEEPLAHPVIGTTFFLAQFVRENLKVVLIGEGSDELFAGYPHYRLFRPPYSFAPAMLTRRYFFTVAYLMPEARTLTRLLHPDWLNRPLLDHVAHVYEGYLSNGNMSQGGLWCELENELVYNQLARIDKLTMAHSVEARVPFLDRAFAEVAYNTPFDLKIRDGTEKYILRFAMRDYLPASILYRPKSGKSGTQALLPALVNEALRPQITKYLAPDCIQQRGWFHPDAVHNYLAGAKALTVRHHPIEKRRRAKFALALVTLERWAQLFLDGKMSSDINL